MRTCSALLVGALFLGATTTLAAPAPLLDWRTVRTEWCDVHYHLEAETVGRRAAAMCDEALEASALLLDAVPTERVQVVVADTDDRANGFALTVPYNQITLLTIGPDGDSELSHTEDSVRLVLFHEMFHIVHLEVQGGLPRTVNRVLGKVWPPNLVQPRWMVEGMAVYAESRLTDGGRLRTDQAEALLRTAALEDDLWALDDLSSYSRRPPGGNAAYLYGGAFIAWLVEEHGEAVLGRLAREYGAYPVPFGLQRSFKRAVGIDLTDAWDAFREHVRSRAQRVVDLASGRDLPHAPRRLTRLGGSLDRGAFGPDGTFWFAARTPNEAAALFRVRGLPDAPPVLEPMVRVNSSGPVTVLADGSVVLAQVERHESRFIFSDLFVFDADGVLRPLTRGARLRSPRVMPDGAHVLAIERTGVHNALVKVHGGSGVITPLKRYDDGTQLLEAAPHPRKPRALVLEHRLGGGRALVEIDLVTASTREVVADAFDLLDPVYTPDGDGVIFSTNRSGVFNLERIDLVTGARALLTNTLGLAAAPTLTPDGRGVVFVDIDAAGEDLYSVALGTGLPVDDPVPPAPALRPTPPSTATATLYNPFASLGPRTWFPTFGNDATGGTSIGVSLNGADAVGIVSWAAQVDWAFGFMRPQVALSGRLNGLFTPVAVNAEWYTDNARFDLGDGEIVTRRETVLSSGASLSWPFRRWLRDHTVSVGYSRSVHIAEEHKVGAPDDPAPSLPPSNNIGSAVLAWSYSDALRFRDDVASSQGQSFSTRLKAANQLTLSELDLYEWTFDARLYRPVPGLESHAVGLYVSGGWAFGVRNRRANYRVGGFEVRDFTGDLLGSRRYGGNALRGYTSNVAVGDGYYFASGEYRFPLVEIERGIESLPLHLTRLSGAAFCDAGDAFDGFPRVSSVKVGVGAELRLEMLIGYYGYLLFRAGFARGLMSEGVNQPYVVLGVPY